MSTSTPRSLLIFPCNGNAVEALDCLGHAYTAIGFIDDTPEKQGKIVHGIPVLPRRALLEYPQARVLAVPGGPRSFRRRKEIIEALPVSPDRLATVIHPAARISPLAKVGRNVLIMAGVVITSNASIGDHVCILPNTVVHHDAVVGDYALVGSNVTIAGSVSVGCNCYIGSGSRLMNGIDVAAGALVGLGSNVIRSVPAGTTVAGNPARPLVGSGIHA